MTTQPTSPAPTHANEAAKPSDDITKCIASNPLIIQSIRDSFAPGQAHNKNGKTLPQIETLLQIPDPIKSTPTTTKEWDKEVVRLNHAFDATCQPKKSPAR